MKDIVAAERRIEELDAAWRKTALGWGQAESRLQAALEEVAALRAALEWAFPASEGFTEAFDGLIERGLLVEVPADEAFKEEWDADTMYVWRWRVLAAPEGAQEEPNA